MSIRTRKETFIDETIRVGSSGKTTNGQSPPGEEPRLKPRPDLPGRFNSHPRDRPRGRQDLFSSRLNDLHRGRQDLFSSRLNDLPGDRLPTSHGTTGNNPWSATAVPGIGALSAPSSISRDSNAVPDRLPAAVGEPGADMAYLWHPYVDRVFSIFTLGK